MSRNTRILFIAGNILLLAGLYIRFFHFEDAYFIPGILFFLGAIFLITFSSVRAVMEKKENQGK